MKSLHELFVELETWLAHFRHHAAPQVAPPVQEVPHPSVETPVETPNPTQVAHPSVTDLLFGKPSGEAAPPAPAQPVLDTSAPTLDFNVVGNGVPINLTGPKTIVNCPASVVVQVQQASGQSGASNTYTATVNGIAAFCPNVQAQLTVPAQGPVVTVSVDCPGLQMEIRG